MTGELREEDEYTQCVTHGLYNKKQEMKTLCSAPLSLERVNRVVTVHGPHSRLWLCSARPDGYHMYTERVIIEGATERRKVGNEVGTLLLLYSA